MLNWIRELITGSPPPPRQITNKRLVPDPNRVLAGFSFWLRSLRKVSGQATFVPAQSEQKAFLAGLEARGLKRTTAGVPLESPFLDDVLEQFRKWKLEPEFGSSATFSFLLKPDAHLGWEWYEIRKKPDSPVDLRKWRCRADRMPTHVDWVQHDFISERCKAAIEAAGLTGLQFTWLSDVGRYRAPQWFHVSATHPLGRGLDNPFLDPAKVVQPDHLKQWYTFDTWRFGRYWITKAELRNGISFGIPAADALLEMFPDRDLTVKGFRQMIRKFIPSSDFAYVWDFGLIPTLCCNARSREFLLHKGFLPADAFEPIWVWDDVPDGANVLDHPGQNSIPPYPLVEPDWRAIQEKLPGLSGEFLRNSKPECKTTSENVLSRLRALHHAQPAPPVIASKNVPPRIADHVDMPKLPRLWEQVLAIADGLMFFSEDEQGKDSDVYEAVPISEIGQRHTEMQTTAKHYNPSYPDHLLNFASEACGDWLAFDMSSLTPDGDCRVVKYSHETLCRVREWPSIIQLLEESVEIEEKEQGES